MPTTLFRTPVAAAAAACLAVGAWQATTVQINYEGKISGLFCIGRDIRLPERALQSTPIFRQNAPFGYDGTSYWLIALDPFFERGTVPYLDDARVRYRRILVPGLAWVLSAGNPSWTPVAYVAVVLGFVFLGVFATARLFSAAGWSALHGLWFLILPATLTSIDRMTVDVAIAALLVVWLVLGPEAPWLRCLTLACAALTRETGLLLIAADVVWTLLCRRRVADTVPSALAAIPALLWYGFVAGHTAPSEVPWLSWIPLQGLLTKLMQPRTVPASAPQAIVQALDLAALCGALAAFVCLIRYVRPPWQSAAAVATWIYGLQAAMISLPDAWSETYAYGRSMTPFWGLVALAGVYKRSWIPALPLFVIALRTALQWNSQIKGVWWWILK